MSDIRTRVAAAVVTHADYIADGSRHCTCGEWNGDSQTTRIGFAAHVADAVIRKLALMIDDSYRISYGTAFIVHGYYEVRDDE